MKSNAAGDDYLCEFCEPAIDGDWPAVTHQANLHELVMVVCIMFDGPDALRDERGKELLFFIGAHRPVNAGGKDDRYVGRPNSAFNQTADQQVDNLRAAGGARCV